VAISLRVLRISLWPLNYREAQDALRLSAAAADAIGCPVPLREPSKLHPPSGRSRADPAPCGCLCLPSRSIVDRRNLRWRWWWRYREPCLRNRRRWGRIDTTCSSASSFIRDINRIKSEHYPWPLCLSIYSSPARRLRLW